MASLLTILASGLALIFGLRDVMNFAHGALYMVGAYLGYTVASRFNFWVALVSVPILLALVAWCLSMRRCGRCNGARTWTSHSSPSASRSCLAPW